MTDSIANVSIKTKVAACLKMHYVNLKFWLNRGKRKREIEELAKEEQENANKGMTKADAIKNMDEIVGNIISVIDILTQPDNLFSNRLEAIAKIVRGQNWDADLAQGLYNFCINSDDWRTAQLFVNKVEQAHEMLWNLLRLKFVTPDYPNGVEIEQFSRTEIMMRFRRTKDYSNLLRRWLEEYHPDQIEPQQADEASSDEQPTPQQIAQHLAADEAGGEQPSLPKELATEEAKALFAKIPQCKQDGSLYKWDGTTALFGYFVDVTSGRLDIRPSNDRLPWKLYKVAFQMTDKQIGTAKQAVNDYKNKELNKPEGYREIERAVKK